MNRGTRRQERRRYNPVSSHEGDLEGEEPQPPPPLEEEEDDEEDHLNHIEEGLAMEVVSGGDNGNNINNSNHNRRPRGRQQYNRISNASEEEEQEEEERIHSTSEHSGTVSSTTTTTITTATEGLSPNKDVEDDNDDDDDDANKFTVTILDFAQKRFQVTVSPTWSVRRLKQAGAKIHKVAPARQRLIFRGKMLADGDHGDGDDDSKTLKDYGITEDGTIVHLFPKPRVVITNSAANANAQERGNVQGAGTNDDDDDDDDDDSQDGEGARVPTIIMDAAEAERRSQILVLGSTDFIEAQNNVKLFSFMLLIISSIELLNLFGIAMGVPQDASAAAENAPGIPVSEDDYHVPVIPSNDDFFSPSSSSNHTGGSEDDDPVADYLSHWGPAQWADTLVSLLGVYVALLGLRASTHNTLRLARTYFLALIGVGIGWLLYNFFQTVEIEFKFEEKKQEQREENNNNNLGPPLTESDIYNQAFQVMLLPALVWFMCWMRAWQFQQLLHEAEAEAEDRIQTQLHLEEQEAEAETSDHNNNSNSNSNTTARHLPNHDEEMALNNSNAVLT